MKKIYLCLALLCVFLLPTFFARAVYVNGYYRSNGTYVNGYERTAPDGNPYNNYGYPGNYNPNTGKTTGGNPDTYLNNYYGGSSANNYSYPALPSYPTIPTCPINSYYDGVSSCKCNYGYVVSGGSCVSASSICYNQLGYSSSYDSLSNTCKCNSGYVIGDLGQCVSGSSYCSTKFGYHSTYNSLGNTCACDSGYKLDGNSQCVQKTISEELNIDTSDTSKRGVVYVPYTGCDHFLIQDQTGSYTNAEWYSGVTPDDGDIVYGDFQGYGFKDIYDQTHDRSTHLWLDDYWVSEDNALQYLKDNCSAYTFDPSVMPSAAYVPVPNSSLSFASKITPVTPALPPPVTPVISKLAKNPNINLSVGLGSSGSSVVGLQRYLEGKGFLVLPKGTSEGYFGNTTKIALIKYQQSVGLPPTGYCGSMTRQVINTTN